MPEDTSQPSSLDAFYAALHRDGLVQRLFELAYVEDLGTEPSAGIEDAAPTRYPGDITTDACVDVDAQGQARVVARSEGTLAGLACVPDLLEVFCDQVALQAHARDGDRIEAGQAVATLEGELVEILRVERTLLNLLGRLSGVATLTQRYVRAMRAGGASRAGLFDTRKTTPGLRVLEKYAVRCGGGSTHRLGLYDAVLIKDNHLAGVPVRALAEFVRARVARARELARGMPLSFVEVEVDTPAQFDALLTLPAGIVDVVLLDNMGVAQLRDAARLRDARNPGLLLEASGGITLETIGAVAQTGVDRISVGAITHSAVQLDLGLDFA